MLQRLDRGDGGVQFLGLVLGEIAHHQLARRGEIAPHRRQLARQQLGHGGFAVAVLAQQRDAVLRVEAERKIGEDGLARLIADRRAVHGDQRRRGFGRLGNADRSHELVGRHFDLRHLGQHLHAALRLRRLGRRRLEAVDEFLHVRARRVLFLGEGQVVGAGGGAGLDESIVAAGIELQLAPLQMQDEFAGGIQKVAVMADDQHGAAIAQEKILQPQHAFQVEIVGGLVQQQQVGCGEEDRRQRHAHAPAAGKFLAGAQLVFRRKAQAGQNFGGAGRRGIGVDGFQAVIDVAQLVAVGFVFGFGQQARALGVGFQHGVEQADIGAGRFLRHRAHLPGGGPTDVAVIGVQAAQDDVEQGGLAGAVAAHQPDAPPGGQVGGGAGEDFPARDPNDDVVYSQHLWGLITVLALEATPPL